MRKFTESLWFYFLLGAMAFLMLAFAVKGWPADTQDERIAKLEEQSKQQREIIVFLYWTMYGRCGSKDPLPIAPKGLKKWLKN